MADHATRMEDECNALVSWFLALVSFAILMAAVLAVLDCAFRALNEQPPPVRPEFTEADRAHVKARHKFHGITSAKLDHTTGERYFNRDGKRCRL